MAQVHMVCACVEDAVNALAKVRYAKTVEEKVFVLPPCSGLFRWEQNPIQLDNC